MEGARKHPARAVELPLQRVPTAGSRAPDIPKDRRLSWGLKIVDFDGDWAWPKLDPAHIVELHRRLATEYEGKTLYQLESSDRVKRMPVEHVCRKARTRLADQYR